MNTPIRDFVLKYCEENPARFHMPGHKGKSFLGAEKYDITEIDGADVLYSPSGIIKESEENASKLFSTYKTFYSCEGSSLCIKAMLALVASQRRNKERKARLLAARNVHKAFVYGCALCDIDVEWIYGKEGNHLCSCVITPEALRRKLADLDGDVDGVYITSPDYLGQISDIKALSEVCDSFSLPLLVDNAHGAYLAFLDESLHPINNGAYMCCDSAHKTLPVLTGGAYLHLSHKAEELSDKAENMMSLMGSTSPSYLILQSLDLCNKYIYEGYTKRLEDTVKAAESLKNRLLDYGFNIVPSEPLKLVLDLTRSCLTKDNAVVALIKAGIVPEFYDKSYIVFMLTPENTSDDFKRLFEALISLKREELNIASEAPYMPSVPLKSMSIRDAVFSDKEIIAVAEAEGRICASPTVSCPPAVPVVISGEIIGKNEIELMLHFGNEKIEVVR